MEIKLNGKALLLGIVMATSYAFADYVVTVQKGYNVVTQDDDRNNAPYVVKSTSTSNGGYTEWSNCYKEAWGSANDTDIVNYPVNFSSLNTINIQLTRHSETGDLNAIAYARDITTTQFQVYVNGGPSSDPVYWSVKGF